MSAPPVDIDLRQFEKTLIAGRYQLTQYLDEGGFGAVFAATHRAFGRDLRKVAVKIAKHPMSDDEASDVFGDALRLAHLADAAPDPVARSRFVTLHDAGRVPDGESLAGHPYVVMEFVPGGSLQHALRFGRFPLRRTMNYFDQILEGVAFMHGHSPGREMRDEPLVHRDIKPGNVLVTRHTSGEDSVKISDFGLAIKVDTLLGWVQSGGDLTCLAPECFSHDICSPQSDVYSLGLLFYEMLTGDKAFGRVGAHLTGRDDHSRMELRDLHYRARLHERFAGLDEDPELSQRSNLLAVIRKALAFEMRNRFLHAGEFKMAWERAKGPAASVHDDAPDRKGTPAEQVEALTDEAERYLRDSRAAEAEALLRDAEKINAGLPGMQSVGRAWLRLVEALVQLDRRTEAWAAANRGLAQRKCSSTWRAMAHAATANKASASNYQKEAASCPDRT